MILRCPVILGVNDDDEHLRAIVSLSEKYPSVLEVNVMAYHDMAKGKIGQIGFQGKTQFQSSMAKEEKQNLFRRLKEFGCDKLNINA